MLILALLAACTNGNEPLSVDLSWEQVTIACTGGGGEYASWTVPEPPPVMVMARLESDNATQWASVGGAIQSDGTIAIPCSSDVVLTYALAE